jgi:general secretion pathway protein D
MDLEANDSKAGDPADGITIGVQDGVPIQSPIYDDVTAITTIAARSGQTVVFGGLITSDRTDTFRGVPYLSDIPVLGHLFRFDTKSDLRSELLFFLTPHIVMDDEDVETLNQREADRMSWCLADVVQLHGDPGFGASRIDTWNEGTPLIYPTVDPTADGAARGEGTEAVPMPQGQPIMEYSPPNANEKPFVLPPEQRQEGKSFIVPPAERQEGKPFVLPPGGQPAGKPFIERTDQSLQRGRGARVELQPAVGWQAPRLQEAVPVADATPTPAQVIPATSQETSAEQQPAPLANGLPTTSTVPRTVQTAYPAAPYPAAPASQRPYSQFPYVK